MNNSNKKLLSLPAKQSGYSIIELLVASVIGLIILSGAVTVFTGNKSSQEFSSGMARIQESGRVALDILSNDIRLAGFQGCTDGTIPPSVIASDGPTIDLPQGALWGGEFGNTTWSPTINADLTTISSQVKSGTDVIYVQHASGRTTILASSMSSSNGPISVELNPDQLVANDLVIISDCSNADIFRATSVSEPSTTDGTVSIGFAAGSANTRSTLSTDYQVSATAPNRIKDPMRVMRFEANAYFVKDSGRDDANGNSIYSLFVLDTTASPIGAAMELVEGVENMQILYGQRLPNGTTQYLKAGHTSLDMENVVSIQIGILVSSTESISNDEDDRTYMVANEKIGPPGSAQSLKHGGGNAMRAAFNTTIQLRNRSANL